MDNTNPPPLSDQGRKKDPLPVSSNVGEGTAVADHIECPFCAEVIKAKAAICRFCHSELPKAHSSLDAVKTSDEQFKEHEATNEKPPSALDQNSLQKLLDVKPTMAGWIGIVFLGLAVGYGIYVLAFQAITWIVLGVAAVGYGMWGRRKKTKYADGWVIAGGIVACLALFACLGAQHQEVANTNVAIPSPPQVSSTQPTASTQPESAPDQSRPVIGEQGYISQNYFGAVDKKALDEMYSALNAKDKLGYQQLFSSGRVISLAKGLKVQVIGADGFLLSANKVRILEGEHQGEAVLVDRSCLSKTEDKVQAQQGDTASNADSASSAVIAGEPHSDKPAVDLGLTTSELRTRFNGYEKAVDSLVSHGGIETSASPLMEDTPHVPASQHDGNTAASYMIGEGNMLTVVADTATGRVKNLTLTAAPQSDEATMETIQVVACLLRSVDPEHSTKNAVMLQKRLHILDAKSQSQFGNGSVVFHGIHYQSTFAPPLIIEVWNDKAS